MRNFWSLFAAYLISWAIFFGFLLIVSSRLSRVQEEVNRLRELLRRE
jgi:hypothetical protein